MQCTHSLIVLASLLFGQAHAATPDVIVVTTQPDRGINYPTIDFFQATVTDVKTTGTWTVAPLAQVRGLMKGQRSDLGPIPSLPRSELTAALPGVTRKDGESGRGVIKSLQRALDTLAVDAAIVVDCEPSGQSAVNGCGLYYYDRAEGRITATARKDFRAGVNEAGRWAPTLVATLKRGMESVRSEREKARFSELLDRSVDANSAPFKLSLGLDASGESLATPDAHLSNQMTYGLQVLVRGSAAGFGLEGATGDGESSAEFKTFKASARRLGLVVNVRAKALDNLIWETDLAAGAVSRVYESSAGDRLSTRGAYLALRPGLGFEISKRWSLGIGLQLSRYFLGSSESSGRYAAAALNPTAIGALFRVKAEIF